MSEPLKTVKEVAAIYRVSTPTILAWLKDGIISSVVSVPRGSRTIHRFCAASVAESLAAYNKP